jgi:uncharacterized protein (TIGR00251 family)
VKADEGGVTVKVLVKPRASRSRVLGVHDDSLAVAVAAPPVDGAANAELIQVLSRHFGVRAGAVEVLSGHAGRRKRVHIRGVSVDELLAGIGRP